MNRKKFLVNLSVVCGVLSAAACVMDIVVGNYFMAALMVGVTALNVYNYKKASKL